MCHFRGKKNDREDYISYHTTKEKERMVIIFHNQVQGQHPKIIRSLSLKNVITQLELGK
jgi:hypothetical protein